MYGKYRFILNLPVIMSKKMFTKSDMVFLENLINTPSPTWFEYTGQKVWLEYIADYVDDTYVDTYGTGVAVINPDADYKVVIEAHCDEIGRYVNYITDNGLIHVIRNGGSDHLVAPSKKVNIWTKHGPVEAIFWWPAIHTRRSRDSSKPEETPKVENITLDCGALSREEVEKMGIHVGCAVTYQDTFSVLNDRYYMGRALDNRIGWFMIAQVARLLHENKDILNFWLYIVNSVQEEIWLRGAEMIAHSIKPDIAIVTDVCHDTTTPMIKKEIEWHTEWGKWPVLSYAPAVHNKLRDHLITVAEKNKIAFQRMAASTHTGTDTDAFAYTRGGIASTLISLPLRYMHTTVEMVRIDDVEDTVRLMYETVKSLKGNEDWKYFK